jgi:hypothetical protein
MNGINPEFSHNPEEPQREYSFDEGVAEAAIRIEKLIKELNRDVVIVVNGSGRDVGKTTLLKSLGRILADLGVVPRYLNGEDVKAILEASEGRSESERGVYLVETEGRVASSVDQYKLDCIKTNRLIGDLYVGIYKPDKGFLRLKDQRPVADVLIRNEFAINDPGKLQNRTES